jgi:predicted PurR-regulated permease PerM
MNATYASDRAVETRLSKRLMDVLIRAGLVLALAILCYQIFSPFVGLMAWALILAVTLYPTHQKLARKMGGRQGLAATLLTLAGIVVIVLPTAVLMGALGDSLHDLVDSVRDNTLVIPAPAAGVAEWPIVGKKAHAAWTRAHEDLPALVKSLQPKIGALARSAVEAVASIAGAILLFVASFIVAGIIMAFGRAGAGSAEAIFDRIMGTGRGAEFVTLSSATIRAVALGVLGVAFIQAIVIGLIMLVAGIPFAGALALLVLVLGIAQVPALLVTLPVIVYVWASGDYGTGAAVTYSVLLFVGGMLDNVLKPLLLGRGVDAPMPVVLLGALGGLATSGILGMFIGATLLTLGYQIFMWWVAENPDVATVESGSRAAA